MIGESAIYRTLTPSLDGGLFGTAGDRALLHLAPGHGSGRYSETVHWLAPTPIDSLYDSPSTGLWVGTLDGLYQQAGADFKRVPFAGDNSGGVVVAIREDHDDRLLALLGSGQLYRQSGADWECLSPGHWNSDNDAVGFTVTPQGTIWIACRAAKLACFHLETWRTFAPPILDLPQGAMGIASDQAGGLWWNTYGEGVFQPREVRFPPQIKALKFGHFLRLRQDLHRSPGRDLNRSPSLKLWESPGPWARRSLRLRGAAAAIILLSMQAAGGTKYLVVDDHPRTRIAMIEALGRPGDTFHEAASGEQAAKLYELTLPDWVIMDIRMPGLDGLAAARRIVARYPEARILLVSQFDDEEMMRQAHAAGARGFVSKDAIADLRSVLEQM